MANGYCLQAQQEHRTHLVHALRSGRYVQCQGALTRKNDSGLATHCCLGVATQLMGCCPYYDDSGRGVFLFSGKYEDCLLNKEVKDYYGFRDRSGEFYLPDCDEAFCLTELNDMGFTFQQIADIIAWEPSGLFSEGDDQWA